MTLKVILTYAHSCDFSIIGIQSFKGSFRRTCHLSPVLGEDEISLGSQRCGAYIDPVTLDIVGYLSSDGTNASPKGFVCPLGQVCKVCAECSTSRPLSQYIVGGSKSRNGP